MPLNRRDFVARTAAVAAGTAVAAGASGAAAEAATPQNDLGSDHSHRPPRTYSFSVLGTTDVHGNCVNWDYFKNAEYEDAAQNDVGLAKISTLVKQLRAEIGHDRTLLIDAGDMIQGTQLSYYFARVAPITVGGHKAPKHPMALAMNHIRYDAAALGNHEFNYGIPTLRAFEKQCDFPLLAANAIDSRTSKPAFRPYIIKRIEVHGAPDIKVGILGLTNPGIAIWDKANVAGQMTFPGIAEQAAVYVPRLRSAGADVVVVSAHSGIDEPTSYGDQLPWPEDASGEMAANVPGIDAVLVGHTHKEVDQRLITNTATGRTVVLSEPLKWGMRLTRFDFVMELVHGAWKVNSVSSTVLNSNTVAEDPEVTKILAKEHAAVIAYVNQVIGSCTAELSIAEAPFQNVPIIDLIGRVQQDTVKAGLAGTAYANLPVLAQAAPFNRTADIPAGQVRLRDAAGLYIYENTLAAVILTGAQIKDYLEFSAEYYNTLPVGAPIDKSTLTNANGLPDYNYDEVYGVSYDIDVSHAVGSRILNLNYNGAPIDPAQQFALAVNNYRASGGGNFPHVATAQQIWSSSDEIRNTIIAWVKAKGSINPADFAAAPGWRLVRNGVPLF
ncbi:2',3'-cyclic-nucleotide 2'-phosphodiesterase/3'-nucleotidase [Streptacidiphilus sp. MAP12-16]|uniref:bifunctional metallophosphatase/5'-nucleotidase n=1 Tax=Streptacidiphilus sp. MAP12-16 TaxID=3156300 RepID=UPI003513D19B